MNKAEVYRLLLLLYEYYTEKKTHNKLVRRDEGLCLFVNDMFSCNIINDIEHIILRTFIKEHIPGITSRFFHPFWRFKEFSRGFTNNYIWYWDPRNTCVREHYLKYHMRRLYPGKGGIYV